MPTLVHTSSHGSDVAQPTHTTFTLMWSAAEIIDVDALPEESNHPRRSHTVLQHTTMRRDPRTTATIDLTTVDDSDSDISIVLSPTKPAGGGTSKGKGKEMVVPSVIGSAIEKIRVCTSGPPNSLQKRGRHSSQAPVPPAKKLKLSTPPPASREQSLSSTKIAAGSSSNEPIASTSTIATQIIRSSSDFSAKLSKEKISQAELAELSQTLSRLHPHSASPSSTPATTAATANNSRLCHGKDKGKRAITCIELSSDGEVVESVNPQKVRSYLMFLAFFPLILSKEEETYDRVLTFVRTNSWTVIYNRRPILNAGPQP